MSNRKRSLSDRQSRRTRQSGSQSEGQNESPDGEDPIQVTTAAKKRVKRLKENCMATQNSAISVGRSVDLLAETVEEWMERVRRCEAEIENVKKDVAQMNEKITGKLKLTRE